MATAPLERRALRILFTLNAAMFVVEVAAGLFADSMGLLADGLDMLADAVVYGLSLRAVGGSDRRKVRAAFAAGYTQLTLAALATIKLVWSAVHGSDPEPAAMAGVSVIALVANAAAVVILRRHRQRGVHLRAAWIFTATDVQVNILVIIAALLVSTLKSAAPDLVVGAVICAIVYRSVWRILADARRARAEIGRRTF